MSSSNINHLQSEANNLNYIAMMFIRCYCCLAMAFGLVGHLLNIYVFTRPSLRSNPCTRYFLAATAIGMITTLYTLPIRLIQSGFIDTDPGSYSMVFCKMTWLVQYSIRHVESSEIRVSCLHNLIARKHRPIVVFRLLLYPSGHCPLPSHIEQLSECDTILYNTGNDILY